MCLKTLRLRGTLVADSGLAQIEQPVWSAPVRGHSVDQHEDRHAEGKRDVEQAPGVEGAVCERLRLEGRHAVVCCDAPVHCAPQFF